MEDQIKFDEIDANILLNGIRELVRSKKWDISDPCDWEYVVAMKDVQKRLEDFLDGDGASR